MNSTVLREVRRDARRLVERIRNLSWLGGARDRHAPTVHKLEDAYRSGWRDCPCVFVLSTGRVGSQTLTALLALSPQVDSRHEPHPRLVRASFDAYLEGGDLGASAMWRQVVYASRDDLVCEASRRGRIYFESNNRLTYLAPVLAECFPASRFIHLHRDPFDVVRSAMRRGYYESHNWDFARVRPRPGEPLAAEWERLSRLEKCAWFWSRINDEASAFLAKLPPERALDLRSDLLFAGDEAILRRVYAFVGVAPPPRERIEKVLGLKLNDAKAGHFPRDWSEANRAAVWRWVEPVATRLGYTVDGPPRSTPHAAAAAGQPPRLAFA